MTSFARMLSAAVLSSVLLVTAPFAEAKQERSASEPKTVYDVTVRDIDGKSVNLSRYKGKVLLIVNVASKCGLTPQYEALQALYDRYKSKGLVVLGVPANEFGNQEPGTDAEIKQFCTTKYRVTYPMFSKIVVKGEGQHSLYRLLTSAQTEPEGAGEISWNFTKFLISRSGRIAARFSPRTRPDDPALVSALEELLKEKPQRRPAR